MNICGPCLAYPRFIVRTRRARLLSVTGSLTGHFLFVMLTLSGAAGMFELARVHTPDHKIMEYQPEGDFNTARYSKSMQMVELPAPVNSRAIPGSQLDSAFYRKLMRKGIKDTRSMSTSELQKKLRASSMHAAGISDESLVQIGRLLGLNPGKYKVRTYYKDELNPNINFHHARVTRAFHYKTQTGAAGYTITLSDREHDEFTFTLEGEAVREFEQDGVRFKGRALAGKGNFELNDAVIKDIRRFRTATGHNPAGGSVVTMVDTKGNVRKFHVRGSMKTPLVMAGIAFARRPDGKFMFNPDDETTVFTSLVDTGTMTLWSVSPVKPTKNGRIPPMAKVVMLDAKGNRLIYFVKGKEARNMLSRAQALGSNSVTRKIYQKTGLAGLLLKLYQQKNDIRKQKIKKDK